MSWQVALVVWVVVGLLLAYLSRWSALGLDADMPLVLVVVCWPLMPFVLLGWWLYRCFIWLLHNMDTLIAFFVLARVVERNPQGTLYRTRLPGSPTYWGGPRQARIRFFVLVRDPKSGRVYRHPLPPRGNDMLIHPMGLPWMGVNSTAEWTLESALAWMAGLPPNHPYEPKWEA